MLRSDENLHCLPAGYQKEENFLATPASVYLRGFVKAVARDLKLNAERVAQSYMERYEEFQRQ